MSKTMAEIIKDAIEFTPYWVNGGLNQDPYENAVKALSAAGFGLVADAKAEALEDAADLLNDLWTWEWADALGEARDLLRARAAALREPVKPTPEGR